jgi:hypothetical protein
VDSAKVNYLHLECNFLGRRVNGLLPGRYLALILVPSTHAEIQEFSYGPLRRVAASPGRRVSGSPLRRVSGSSGRRVVGPDADARSGAGGRFGRAGLASRVGRAGLAVRVRPGVAVRVRRCGSGRAWRCGSGRAEPARRATAHVPHMLTSTVSVLSLGMICGTELSRGGCLPGRRGRCRVARREPVRRRLRRDGAYRTIDEASVDWAATSLSFVGAAAAIAATNTPGILWGNDLISCLCLLSLSLGPRRLLKPR